MEQGSGQESICRSVFKSGDDAERERRFTTMWLELNGTTEKRKISPQYGGNDRHSLSWSDHAESACSVSVGAEASGGAKAFGTTVNSESEKR